MNLNIFVAISLSAVLMTVIFVDAGTTEAVSTAVATKNTSPTTKTNAPKAGSSESTVNKALSSKTGPTSQSTASKSTTTKPGGGTRSNTPTTTPKQILCSIGTCDDFKDCFNATTLGKTCAVGERCAVSEEVNATVSTYTVSCKPETECQSIEKAGKGACCSADNCVPDLDAAKAAFAKANEGSGCDSLLLNMNVVFCLITVLFTIL